MNLIQIQNEIKQGNLTVRSLAESYLANIERYRQLNAFISVFKEKTLSEADRIDLKFKNKTQRSLAGLIISVKDVIAVKDEPLTCASKILENFYSLYNASAVQRLLDEDAIIIGKTNCDEFAMGSSNENSYFGSVKNPFDHSRVPGGSSGGSAVSVAAGMCLASLGSDTGGSVRQPASLCGVTGLKVTYGRISRHGLTAFASSLDSIGIIAKSGVDIALILGAVSGFDINDSTSSKQTVPDYLNDNNSINPEDITFGIPDEYFPEDLQPEISERINFIISSLKSQGFKIINISLPHTKYVLPAYHIISDAEASANLARYDGVRYGNRAQNISDTEEMYVKTRSEGFGAEVKRRIMLGTFALSGGYYDKYYGQAQKVRMKISDEFISAFKNVDFILTPATPSTAFELGGKTENPLSMYQSDIFTASANLAGIPAISIPAGTDKQGLPFGVQIFAGKFNEEGLLKMWNKITNKIYGK